MPRGKKASKRKAKGNIAGGRKKKARATKAAATKRKKKSSARGKRKSKAKRSKRTASAE